MSVSNEQYTSKYDVVLGSPQDTCHLYMTNIEDLLTLHVYEHHMAIC